MRTEAQKRAEQRYKSKQTVVYAIRLNRKTDADLIQMLEGKNKTAIIKEALRLHLALEDPKNYCRIDETA